MKLPRVVFFGNERLVSGLTYTDTPILRGLIDSGYDVQMVVANHTDAKSRNRRPLEVADLAKAHNIPVLLPAKPADIVNELRAVDANCAILSAYGRIIPQCIIDVFSPIGIINVHPSLLPQHRGPTPIETTIMTGDKTTGVSIMQLTKGMDEGPIYGQTSFSLTGTETKFELYDRLSKAGTELLFSLLPSILDGSIKPRPQENDSVSYTTLISKSDGTIDPETDTAETISRKVRAYLGFPKSRLSHHNNDVIVTAAKSIPAPLENEFCLPCAQNSTLLVESVIAPSGKMMTGSAFLRGLR